MAVEDALHRLQEEHNEQINWAIGNLLSQRAAREDWRQCPLLQHLENGAPNLNSWNELFRRTRGALEDQAELPRKAETLLQPANAAFDALLDDFIAEMLAAQYLAFLGHEHIHFISHEEAITADLKSIHHDIAYITEAKNLREPNSLTYVAFERWHHNRAARPDLFNFTVEFLALDDPLEDLTSLQTAAVRELVDGLPQRQRPSTFAHVLPGNRRVRVHVAEGRDLMVRHGPGPFLVNEVVEECQRAVVMKMLEPSRKALTQLYSTAVPVEYRRLLFVRWKPPDQIVVIDEADNVRSTIQNMLQTFLRRFFPNFAITILHTVEQMENVPVASWE